MEDCMRLEFEDFPGHSLAVLLFKDVTNSKELRDQVISNSLMPECSLVNAEVVPNLFVLHVAAHKALAAQQRGTLRTRSLHAELVFNLSGSKHIAETLGRFGISPECQHMLAARFDATPEEVEQLKGAVAGSLAPLSELAGLVDQQRLSKYLKTSAEELSVGSMADALLVRIAARDC